MTVAEKIFSLWSADATAIALVPAARFKPSGLYQDIDYPWVMFWRITGERYRTIAEGVANALERDTWQFSIHASGPQAYTTADAIRLKLIDVFDGDKAGFHFRYQGPGPTITSPDKQYLMIPVDFSIFAS